MSNEQDIQKIVAVIGAAYPNFSPTEQTVEVYFQILKDIEADELRVAVLHCVAEAGRKFAPSVGEIRGAIAELRRAAANVPDAYSAWQETWRKITRGNDEDWSHPLIERVVDSLGFRNLCMSENPISDRARFIDAYEQLLSRAQRENMILPEVRIYIEDRGGKMLEAPEMKQLTEKLEKPDYMDI